MALLAWTDDLGLIQYLDGHRRGPSSIISGCSGGDYGKLVNLMSDGLYRLINTDAVSPCNNWALTVALQQISEFLFNSPKLDICLKGLCNLCSIWHPLSSIYPGPLCSCKVLSNELNVDRWWEIFWWMHCAKRWVFFTHMGFEGMQASWTVLQSSNLNSKFSLLRFKWSRPCPWLIILNSEQSWQFQTMNKFISIVLCLYFFFLNEQLLAILFHWSHPRLLIIATLLYTSVDSQTEITF